MAKSRADKMTIVEHLVEFRKRLIAVVLCYIIVFLVAFVFGGELYQALTASLHQKLLVLGPNDILWIYVSLANLTSFSLTLPFIVYQIWQFVRPALKEKGGACSLCPTFQLALFALCWGLHLVISLSVQLF